MCWRPDRHACNAGPALITPKHINRQQIVQHSCTHLVSLSPAHRSFSTASQDSGLQAGDLSPCFRGYLVSWDVEKSVWWRAFKSMLQQPQDCGLLMTEAPFNLPAIQTSTMQVNPEHCQHIMQALCPSGMERTMAAQALQCHQSLSQNLHIA